MNYERLFKTIRNINVSGEIGISSYHLNDYTNTFNPDLIIPFSFNTYYGNKHHIEISLGQSISSIIINSSTDFKPKRETQLNTNLSLGYRYQKPKGKIIFRIAYTPLIERNKEYRHWASISFGTSF